MSGGEPDHRVFPVRQQRSPGPLYQHSVMFPLPSKLVVVRDDGTAMTFDRDGRSGTRGDISRRNTSNAVSLAAADFPNFPRSQGHMVCLQDW